MYIYRPQRSTLIEAMDEMVEFETFEELARYLVILHCNAFDESDVVLDNVSHADYRIKWMDTRYVLVKRYKNKVYSTPQVIGYCATQYD
jgi:hypothetical protein